MKQHTYQVRVDWTGNDGQGTKNYRSYRRDHTITSASKPAILGSSDPSFRGDPARYSPEDLFVAGLSACHMLWYLHLCSANQITVLDYQDDALGYMHETDDGSGAFVRVVLRPQVRLSSPDDQAKALALHHEAHRFCFLAKSVNFPVEIEARIVQDKG